MVVAVGGVLVLLPADLVVLVHVVLPPVFVHVLLDVPPLAMFDPVVQLTVVDEAVLVDVDATDDLPVRSIRQRRGRNQSGLRFKW